MIKITYKLFNDYIKTMRQRGFTKLDAALMLGLAGEDDLQPEIFRNKGIRYQAKGIMAVNFKKSKEYHC